MHDFFSGREPLMSQTVTYFDHNSAKESWSSQRAQIWRDASLRVNSYTDSSISANKQLILLLFAPALLVWNRSMPSCHVWQTLTLFSFCFFLILLANVKNVPASPVNVLNRSYWFGMNQFRTFFFFYFERSIEMPSLLWLVHVTGLTSTSLILPHVSRVSHSVQLRNSFVLFMM